MKGLTPTAESHGFSPDLLWSGLRSGLPAIALAQPRQAGCRPMGLSARGAYEKVSQEKTLLH